MSGWLYWGLFALAALAFAGPWLLFRWEERQDARDRKTWERMFR